VRLNKADNLLIERAKEAIERVAPLNLIDTGEVGAALITSKGKIYTGVSLGFYCGIGSCGEYQAIGSMISNGEKEIKTIVAVWYDEKKRRCKVIPPCGKCREMIHQLTKKNWISEVIVSGSKKVKLKELLPYAWDGTIDKDGK